MSVERYADGYVDWTGFDEDGAVNGFADLTLGTISDGELDLTFDYDDAAYSANLRQQGSTWSGHFVRRASGNVRPETGRCILEQVAAEKDERQFKGKWMEHGLAFHCVVLLRGRVPTRARPGEGMPNKATIAATAPRSPAEPRPQAPRRLDERTHVKIARVARALEDLLAGRSTSPQLVQGVLALHEAIFRGAKRRRKPLFAG